MIFIQFHSSATMRQCERGAGLVGWAVSCVARVEPAGDLARGRVVLFVAGTGLVPQVGRGSSLRWQLALAPRGVGWGNSVVSGEVFGNVQYGRRYLIVISTDEGY